jgi:Cu/Ag efflux pump CusA
VAGAVEESSKGRCHRGRIPVLLFLTFTLLMLQLRSVSRSLLVFITGPAFLAWRQPCCC